MPKHKEKKKKKEVSFNAIVKTNSILDNYFIKRMKIKKI